MPVNSVKKYDSKKIPTSGYRVLEILKALCSSSLSTFEIPFANAHGEEVNEDSAREFGRSLAISIKDFLR